MKIGRIGTRHMTKAAPISLPAVLEILDEKLDEAADFLEEMEITKKDARRFIHRVSAFLSAAGSVTMQIERQARRYARQIGKGKEFEDWYKTQKDAFRTPDEVKKGQKVGTDNTWVYLRIARDDTIHIEQTNLNRLVRVSESARLHFSDGIRVTEHHADGTTKVVQSISPPPPPLEPEPDEVQIEKDLWTFKQILQVDQSGNITDIIEPPRDDVISICKAHMEKLGLLLSECTHKLFELKENTAAPERTAP